MLEGHGSDSTVAPDEVNSAPVGEPRDREPRDLLQCLPVIEGRGEQPARVREEAGSHLRAFPLRDVGQNTHRADDLSVFIADGRRAGDDRAPRMIGADDLDLLVDDPLTAADRAKDRPLIARVATPVRMEPDPLGFAVRAPDVPELLVGEDDLAGGVGDARAHGKLFENDPEEVSFGLDLPEEPFPFGRRAAGVRRVGEDPEDLARSFGREKGRRPDRDFEQLAVARQPLRIQPRCFAPHRRSLEVGAELVFELRRDDRERSADDLFFRPAERRFRRGIPEADQVVGIEEHDRQGGSPHHGAKHLVRRAERILRGARGRDVAENRDDRSHRSGWIEDGTRLDEHPSKPRALAAADQHFGRMFAAQRPVGREVLRVDRAPLIIDEIERSRDRETAGVDRLLRVREPHHPRRRLVHEDDPPRRVHRHHAVRDALEDHRELFAGGRVSLRVTHGRRSSHGNDGERRR